MSHSIACKQSSLSLTQARKSETLDNSTEGKHHHSHAQGDVVGFQVGFLDIFLLLAGSDSSSVVADFSPLLAKSAT